MNDLKSAFFDRSYYRLSVFRSIGYIECRTLSMKSGAVMGMRMDLLSDILTRIKLNGTLYFRTSFTSPWSIKVPHYKNVARFHFAHKGRCFVRVTDTAPPVLLEQGDLIIIPHGAEHTLFCDPETEDQSVHLDKVIAESGFKGYGTLVWGEFGTHHETQLVCGHFAFDQQAMHPIIDALPDYIHARNAGKQTNQWIENTLNLIGSEAEQDKLGGDLIAIKLSEIIFAQALRAYIESEGQNLPVLAGFSDRKIARALNAVHQNPSHSWSVDSLAEIAGMSRTSFTSLFTRCMSSSPLNYVTHWRMQLARIQLIETEDPIIVIAESAGYQSEAAFGRAFKKQFEIAPASYRRQHKTSINPKTSLLQKLSHRLG